MEKSIIINNTNDLNKAADFVINNLSGNKIVCLYADMGAGKTTLIKAICNILNVEDYVTSPTFSIVNEYFSPDYGKIYHFDFYRIKNITEVFDIGIEEYFSENCLIFIEWPELIESILPENHTKFNIQVIENQKRKINTVCQ